MKRYKYLLISILGSISFMMSCSSPTAEELADKSIQLHKDLENAKNKADSSKIWKQITEVEQQARGLGDDEYRRFSDMAHPADAKPEKNDAKK